MIKKMGPVGYQIKSVKKNYDRDLDETTFVSLIQAPIPTTTMNGEDLKLGMKALFSLSLSLSLSLSQLLLYYYTCILVCNVDRNVYKLISINFQYIDNDFHKVIGFKNPSQNIS